MIPVTPETLAAVQALLPGLKITLTSQDVPAGKTAGGTFWTALAERAGLGQVAVSTGDCPRMALGTVLAQVSRLGSRRGSTAEERAAALQAYALLPEA